MSYPPGGPDDYDEQQQPQGQPPQQPLQPPPPQPLQPPQQGGWPMPDPAATQPMYPTAEYPTQPPYPLQGQGAPPGPYDTQQQPPYYPGTQQNPYAQQQQQYPYAQGQQPYAYQYDPNAVYGRPMPGQGRGAQSRNTMIAVLVAVAVLAMGVSVYWFGFHNRTTGSPTALSSSLSSSAAASSPPATESATPDALGTAGDNASALRALMATMTDPGCRAAFQALITFEQASATDAGDDTALLTDYDTAIASLTSAQGQSQDSGAADAIGQVVTDWKAYTASLAAGNAPDESTMTNDGEQLTAACLSAAS